MIQLGMRILGLKVEVASASLGVESLGHGDGLQQSGFAAAVFANQEGDLRVELQCAEIPDSRN
jgi:hypothetical protein